MEAHRLGLMPRPVDSTLTGLTVVLLVCLQVGCGEADTSPERRSQAASHEGGSASDDEQTCRESLTGERTSAKTVREEFGEDDENGKTPLPMLECSLTPPHSLQLPSVSGAATNPIDGRVPRMIPTLVVNENQNRRGRSTRARRR